MAASCGALLSATGMFPTPRPDVAERLAGDDSARIPVGAIRACCSVMYATDNARSSGVGSRATTG